MRVGNWGNIIKFKVSERKVITFKEMRHSIPIQTQKHVTCIGKPKLQFIAPDLETLSFTMELNAMLCKHPKQYEEKLIRAAQSGVYAPLVIGRKTILQKAIITSLSTSYDIVIRDGGIYSLKIDVSMSEYN